MTLKNKILLKLSLTFPILQEQLSNITLCYESTDLKTSKQVKNNFFLKLDHFATHNIIDL